MTYEQVSKYNHEKLTSLPLTHITVSSKDSNRNFYTNTQEVTVISNNIYQITDLPSSLTFARGAWVMFTVITEVSSRITMLYTCWKTHVLLVLAYGFIAHKTQGSTYQYMVANFTKPKMLSPSQVLQHTANKKKFTWRYLKLFTTLVQISIKLINMQLLKWKEWG